MAGSNALDERYDFALLGTSLPLSILSAALARAGFSILHVDDAEHYGGPWSSLTLEELVRTAQRRRAGDSGIVDISLSFRDSPDMPPELASVNRHFAISLAPTLLPCAGATIDVLVRSKVASYCTFRLLQQTAVYSNEVRAKDAWPLRSVPSSKEDIFKDKSLGLADKRRLMKLLQQASGAPPTQQQQQQPSDIATVDADDDEATRRRRSFVASLTGSFHDYLTSRDGPGFSSRLASDVAYGVALCNSSDEPAATAMRRLQRHIASVGRYGNAAYLIGQYGGAGEMAQCYCRSSAVQGGTFVLGHAVTKLNRDASESDDKPQSWQIALDGLEGSSKVDCVVGDADLLQRIGIKKPQPPSSPSRQALGILLLDRGMSFGSSRVGEEQHTQPPPPPQETALLVFPPPDDGGPAAQDGSVWALQMGEGTFSCPKGTYLVYLCAALPQSPDKLSTAEQARIALKHAREGVLRLAQESAREWPRGNGSGGDEDDEATSCTPLFECYMVREADASSATLEEQRQQVSSQSLLSVPSATLNLATALDDATTQAEDLYWLLCGQGGAMNREGAEALRRRQRRTAATYAVGRGLGGAPPPTDNTNAGTDEATAVCDFFPVGDDDEGE